MLVNLSLQELNLLYLSTATYLKQAEVEAKEFPSPFFENQYKELDQLVTKIQDNMYAEADDIDYEMFRDMVDRMNEYQYEDRVLGNI
jgi:hypothetical protein